MEFRRDRWELYAETVDFLGITSYIQQFMLRVLIPPLKLALSIHNLVCPNAKKLEQASARCRLFYSPCYFLEATQFFTAVMMLT